MEHDSEAFVAFDTCKLRNTVAVAEAGRAGEVRFVGDVENSAAATAKLVRKLAGKYARLTFCYEAGPTGYGLYRQIKAGVHPLGWTGMRPLNWPSAGRVPVRT